MTILVNLMLTVILYCDLHFLDFTDLDNFLKNTFPFETRKRKEDQDENKQTSFFDKSSSSM